MKLAVSLSARAGALARLASPAAVPPAADEVSAAARNAAAAALDRGETHYTDRPGLRPLREAVAGRLRDLHDLTTQADDVVITCGVTEARFVAMQRLLPAGSGTVVALGNPELLAGACVIRGLELVCPDAGPGADRGGDDVAVYIPSGLGAEAVAPWLERAYARGWRVVRELSTLAADRELSRHLAQVRDRLYTIGDLSGQFGAEAWRVGFLAAPNKAVGPLREFKQALTLCTTNVSQWGALALIEADA
jgi:DNA-binding transcriptional MocR family regulator